MQSYPVLVTDTREHVVWVQADDADHAVRRASVDTHELLDDETLLTGGFTCTAPQDIWDWREVMEGGPDGYPGMECDAHVEAHRSHLWQVERAATKAACAAVGHHPVNLHTWPTGQVECQLCRVTTVEPPPGPDTNVYLVWSNDAGRWWGPNGRAYTGDVWSAGRYSRDEAVKACGMRTWSLGAPPPEVMVLAPENGHRRFTVDDLRALPGEMSRRIATATAAAIADRDAKVLA